MSAKRKPTVILGPDGKPYVAPPKKAEAKVTVAGVDISNDVKDYSITFDANPYMRSIYDSMFGSVGRSYGLEGRIASRKAAQKPLAEAVAEQVGALVEDFDGHGGAELPKPSVDLHTYADAWQSARKNCQHPNPESTLYSRGEFFCPDCQRYFGPEEYKRTRTGFGGLFG